MIIDKIAANLVLSTDYLWRVVLSASHRYKTYTIPKRTGGVRTINHPARELKLLQYWVLDNVCSRLRVHDAATAYRTGLNIRDHAAIHVQQSYLLKVDFRDFFPSIRRTDVLRVLREHVEVLTGVLEGDQDRELVCRIVCKGDQLTIGAPTSPLCPMQSCLILILVGPHGVENWGWFIRGMPTTCISPLRRRISCLACWPNFGKTCNKEFRRGSLSTTRKPHSGLENEADWLQVWSLHRHFESPWVEIANGS